MSEWVLNTSLRFMSCITNLDIISSSKKKKKKKKKEKPDQSFKEEDIKFN